MLSVSTSPIIARYLENVPAVAISFWRMGFGAIILWGVSLVRRRCPLRTDNLKRTLMAGVFLGIHFALFFGAIKLTTIANAAFLGTLAPVITFLIEKYILKRNHAPALILGLGLAICGAIIIVGNKSARLVKNSDVKSTNSGDISVFACTISPATYITSFSSFVFLI